MAGRDRSQIGRLCCRHIHSFAVVRLRMFTRMLRRSILHHHAMAERGLQVIHVPRPCGRKHGAQQHQHRRDGENPLHSLGEYNPGHRLKAIRIHPMAH